MIEVEGKILNVIPEREIEKLESLGYRQTFDGTLVARFFQNGDKDSLRLRKEGDRWILNHKRRSDFGKGSGFKSMIETETEVSDPEAMETILLSVGFEKVRTVEKRRRTFTKDGIPGIVELDEYHGIPPLLEIEAESPEEVARIATILGFAKSDIVSDSVRDLEKRYGVEFGK